MTPSSRHAASRHLSLVQHWLVAVLLAFGAVAAASQARAADGTVDAIVVRYGDAAVAEGATALPRIFAQSLRNHIAVPFTVVGRTRDGAFRDRARRDAWTSTARVRR